jgi:lysophospholipase L1-like esterase
MQETLLSQVYAIKGLLLEHNLKHTIVIGHEGFDAFNCISDNFSDIPRQAITYMADDHTKVDGMHPDSKGSIIIADKLFDFITDHTDK